MEVVPFQWSNKSAGESVYDSLILAAPTLFMGWVLAFCLPEQTSVAQTAAQWTLVILISGLGIVAAAFSLTIRHFTVTGDHLKIESRFLGIPIRTKLRALADLHQTEIQSNRGTFGSRSHSLVIHWRNHSPTIAATRATAAELFSIDAHLAKCSTGKSALI